LTPK